MFMNQKYSSHNYLTIDYTYFLMPSVIRGFKGPEVQNFDYLYLKRNKYFEKQLRIKDAENDLLKYIQPSKFCYVDPIRR